MSVPKPDIILRLNESSGSTITNYGTLASGNYTVAAGSGAENTHWSWHTNADPALAYISKDTNANYMYATTAATTPGTTRETVNGMIKFYIHDLQGVTQRIVGASSTVPAIVNCITPSGSGNFDLQVQSADSIAHTVTASNLGLLFDTVYTLAWSLDISNIAAVSLSARVNALTTVTSTADWTGGASFDNTWPKIMSDNTGYGLKRVYAFAYQRGDTAWTTTELASITADLSFITGWTDVTTAIPIFQNNYQLR